MITLHESLHQHTHALEDSLKDLERPHLRPRARRRRVVRQARVASVATVGAGALAVGAAWTVPSIWPHDTTAVADLNPAGQPGLPLAADGSFSAAIPTNDVVVDVYLDPMCSACAAFGTTVEPELRAIDGATVVLHPIAFLDDQSADGSYSTRAASAIREVAAGSPGALEAFVQRLWQFQPAEGSTLTDEQLGEHALAVGVPEEVVARFPEHRYASAVADSTYAAIAAGVQGTPAVFADGTGFRAASWDLVVDPIKELARGKSMDIDVDAASHRAEMASRQAEAEALKAIVASMEAEASPAP